jgi:hypothetical protein
LGEQLALLLFYVATHKIVSDFYAINKQYTRDCRSWTFLNEFSMLLEFQPACDSNDCFLGSYMYPHEVKHSWWLLSSSPDARAAWLNGYDLTMEGTLRRFSFVNFIFLIFYGFLSSYSSRFILIYLDILISFQVF